MTPKRIALFNQILRRILAVGLVGLGLLGLFVALIVFFVAQNGGVAFTNTHVSYWQVLIPAGLAICFIVGAGFVWPRHGGANPA